MSESQYRQLFIREERKRKIQQIDFDKMALTHQKEDIHINIQAQQSV